MRETGISEHAGDEERPWRSSDFDPPVSEAELDRFVDYQDNAPPETTMAPCRCGAPSRGGRICRECVERVRFEKAMK